MDGQCRSGRRNGGTLHDAAVRTTLHTQLAHRSLRQREQHERYENAGRKRRLEPGLGPRQRTGAAEDGRTGICAERQIQGMEAAEQRQRGLRGQPSAVGDLVGNLHGERRCVRPPEVRLENQKPACVYEPHAHDTKAQLFLIGQSRTPLHEEPRTEQRHRSGVQRQD